MVLKKYRLLTITLIILSACQVKSPEIFEPVPNGTCSIKFNGEENAYLGIYSFPANLKSYQLKNEEFTTCPLYYPTSETYLNINNIQYRLFLSPGDSIVLNSKNSNLVIMKSNFRAINQYYVTTPTSAREFSLIHSFSFDEAKKATDSLFRIKVLELEQNKHLPKWFYEYEKSRIKSKILFPLVDVATRNLSPCSLRKFFEREFDFTNPFNVYAYSNYTSIMMYLDSFNSEELNNMQKEAESWMVGIEERTNQTMNHLPFEYRDINLANQLILRLEAGIITRNNLHDYYDLFNDKNWYIILEDQLPEESETLLEEDELPYFYLPSISGQFFDSNELLGKYSHINFWSFWCKPCLEKFPKENELAEKHQEINYVNICLDADSARWIDFSKENISTQTINLWANENWSEKLKEKFNIMALPKAILSNENGHIFIKTPPLSGVKLDSIFSLVGNKHNKPLQ
ncbi:MAG: TlpA family protein disulfide reductase [Bacteroidota bacterium]